MSINQVVKPCFPILGAFPDHQTQSSRLQYLAWICLFVFEKVSCGPG